jgi:hypothetical protein
VGAPALTTVPLGGGVDAALSVLPRAAGVGQILAEGGRSLVIGRPSDLRRWAADHLGRARPRKPVPGKLPPRPPTDLTPVAAAVAFAVTPSPFAQRLAYERLMSSHVPPAKRRDLKRPAYLRLDPGERFPRLVVQASPEGEGVFGPFRDWRAAARARDALVRRFRLRSCDLVFEPAPQLAEGLACLHAQVGSCVAPCLVRVPEDGYRALAGEVAALLDGEGERPRDVPPWVRRTGGRSVIVERLTGAFELHPVAAGAVLEAVNGGEVGAAVRGLSWAAPPGAPDDTPWLNAWRHAPHRGIEVPLRRGATPDEDVAQVTAALAGPPSG